MKTWVWLLAAVLGGAVVADEAAADDAQRAIAVDAAAGVRHDHDAGVAAQAHPGRNALFEIGPEHCGRDPSWDGCGLFVVTFEKAAYEKGMGIGLKVTKTFRKRGIELVFIPVDEDPKAALPALPEGCDAVYLMLLQEQQDRSIGRIIDHINKQKLPSFSPLQRRLVELGAGTGRNLLFFGPRIGEFAQVDLVDLCPALLDQARRLDGRIIDEVGRIAAKSDWPLALNDL